MRRRDVLRLGLAGSLLTLAGGTAASGLFTASGRQLVLGTPGRLRREADQQPGRLLRYPQGFLLARHDGPGSVAGFVAVDVRCSHLGCRTSLCASSGWLECACHGAKFNRLGEYIFGPPPRGLDRYRLAVRRSPVGRSDVLLVDLRQRLPGPPRGPLSEDSEPLGPYCEV